MLRRVKKSIINYRQPNIEHICQINKYKKTPNLTLNITRNTTLESPKGFDI